MHGGLKHVIDRNSQQKKDTYICSLHFVGNAGPTSDHPDPIPATPTKYEVNKLICMF